MLILAYHFHETHTVIDVVRCMMYTYTYGVPWWYCCSSSATTSQLHVCIAKWCVPVSCSSIEIVPSDTCEVTPTIHSVKVWVGTASVPPRSSVRYSTVTTAGQVIVSVMCGELHAIQVVNCHAIPCCPYPPVLVPSNSESVVGVWSAHMKMVITGILGMSCKVNQVNSQLSHSYWCQTANLLQAQPMLSLHISKPIFILRPPSVEVLWPITSSLEHGPAPTVVHVAPDGEGLPTPWVYGVHSRPSAAQDIGLLAVKGDGVQVGTADCRGDNVQYV